MIEWDLWDYDPWDEWRPSARERMTDDAQLHMLGDREDRAWAEEDEPRYLAALLAAGAEPEEASDDAHMAWQMRAAEVLMQKYRKHWWFECTQPHKIMSMKDPKYRQKARTCRRDVQVDELRKFYTWLCNQRGEAWTDRLVPY